MSQQFHDRYNFDDGDLILLTSDNVKFRVHSVVLKAGSGVFRDMLELARPNEQNSSEPINLSETRATLEQVFLFLYPVDETILPRPATFEGALEMCEVATKYDMPLALAGMRSVILGAKEYYGDGIDVYIYACRHGWDDVADVASTATLTVGLSEESVLKKLNVLDGPSLYKLFKLHTLRKKQIVDSIQEMKFVEGSFHDPLPCPSALNCSCYEDDPDVLDGPTGPTAVLDVLRGTVSLALDQRPLGDTVPKIFHSWIFRYLDTIICYSCKKNAIDKNEIIIEVTKALSEAVCRISDLKE